MNRTAELIYAAKDFWKFWSDYQNPDALEHDLDPHDPADCVVCRFRDALGTVLDDPKA